MLKVVETEKKSDFVDFKGKIYGDLASNKSDQFSKFVIPKLKASNFLGTTQDKKDGNFLSWSSVNSAPASPPMENVSFLNDI